MSQRVLALTLSAGLLGAWVVSAPAQQDPPKLDQEREASALDFARSHHPELADLLTRLKRTDRNAYAKAIRDVSQTGERLMRLRESDPERYELALQTWTLDSRIRLLAARSMMSDDPAFEERLRELLRERQQVRLATLRVERERVQTRLDKLNEQIGQLESDPVAGVENDLARIRREMKASANRERRAAANPSAAKKKDESAKSPEQRKPDGGAPAEGSQE